VRIIAIAFLARDSFASSSLRSSLGLTSFFTFLDVAPEHIATVGLRFDPHTLRGSFLGQHKGAPSGQTPSETARNGKGGEERSDE